MIKVGIIGCGKIADSHAEIIERLRGCEIVGVCDREELMAKQLFERFKVRRYFKEIDEFLCESKPDIVHITTPPQGHFELGRRCLEAGCHLYIEKPFTVNYSEAEGLISLANDKKLKITVGHDEQFSYVTRKMREMVSQGYLGGAPVHMECYYGYDLGDQKYAKALLGDRDHWIRALPGTLMQNVMSHSICRIAEFMFNDNPDVVAHGFLSPFLKNLGEDEILDEVRVIVSDGSSTTAYFTFSTQMRPAWRHFRVYGPKNGLALDHDQQTLIRIKGSKYKSYLEKFLPQFEYASQYALNSLRNMRMFLKNDLHMKEGMKSLIRSFYRSITDGTPPPIPYREILLTSKIMDKICEQLSSKKSLNKPFS